MKLASKIAASVALLGALTVSRAESITFGVEVPPLASLIVHDGVIRGAKGLLAVITTTGPNAPTVGGFTVVTNMPKWNIYFGLANDGNLINSSGDYLKGTGGTNYLPLGTAAGAAKASGRVWLQFPAANQIIGTDGAATALTITATAATMGAVIGDGVVSNTHNTLTDVLHTPTTTTVCGAAVCADNHWVYATNSSVANFGIGTYIDNTEVVSSLAGTYTETMYVTLLTSY